MRIITVAILCYQIGIIKTAPLDGRQVVHLHVQLFMAHRKAALLAARCCGSVMRSVGCDAYVAYLHLHWLYVVVVATVVVVVRGGSCIVYYCISIVAIRSGCYVGNDTCIEWIHHR